jgi:hypothetical protein
MNKKFHDSLGEIIVLIEAESNGKFYSLVKSYKTKVQKKTFWGWPTDEYEWQFSHYRMSKNQLKGHHYVLWGRSEDLNTRGISHLVTLTGKPKGPTILIKTFMEFVKTSNSVDFKK